MPQSIKNHMSDFSLLAESFSSSDGTMLDTLGFSQVPSLLVPAQLCKDARSAVHQPCTENPSFPYTRSGRDPSGLKIGLEWNEDVVKANRGNL
jgi:hypothetical protein